MKLAGIYIHIPFCAIKCMYCDFYSITDRENIIPKFIDALKQEIEQCEIDVSDWIIDTIFIGGGTPSLIQEKYIFEILTYLNIKYDLSNIQEITLEANPGEAPKNRLKSFREMGINRISIGVQSFQPETLKFLTRNHNTNQIFETYDNVRSAGFDNINCDLIYSIPGQSWKDWSTDLNTIIEMAPEHISAYTLTAEKGTKLFSMLSKKQISMPTNKQESEWFIKTHNILSKNGYQPYEVSNFSKPEYECMHNLHYWNIEPYLAFGPSGHGYDGKRRWNNIKSLDQYIENINSGFSPISTIENISLIDKTNELIGFGMRMLKGLNPKIIPKKLQGKFQKNLKQFEQKYPDYIDQSGENIIFTQKGLLFADQLIPDLLL
ncbi:MAG: radical SAM family heme chaperone HemW [Candidatus Neomarinimicrobiota bacterium]